MDSVPSLLKTEKDDSGSRLAELTEMALIGKGEREKFIDDTLKLLSYMPKFY